MPELYNKKPNTKLSQILRMYYSPDGISLDSRVAEIDSKHVSFCNRQSLVEVLDHEIRDQMKLYGFLIAQTLRDVEHGYQRALSLYNSEKNIFRNNNLGKIICFNIHFTLLLSLFLMTSLDNLQRCIL